jgi:hypothetical protein
MFLPPYTHPRSTSSALKQTGMALLPAADVCQLAGVAARELAVFAQSWNFLGADNYLKDGGKYRSRRHASCVVRAGERESGGGGGGRGGGVQQMPYRPHWQPLDYNALHGGMERWFEPVLPAAFESGLNELLLWLASLADELRGKAAGAEGQAWYTEVHQFRIDTAGGIGRPTPEGAHRDGVDLVAVFLVAREGVKGGETRVFEADSPAGQRFTLQEPWSALLLDDPRMIHETTPIQPVGDSSGYRDTLVVTLRAKSFQDAA